MPPETPQTNEQRLEARRQEIQRNLDVISANMVDLDGFTTEGGSSINVYDRVKYSMYSLGKQVTIFDALVLANAKDAADLFLTEINHRRAARGEPPAEASFDPNKQAATETAPLTSAIEDVDMVKLGQSVKEATTDAPFTLPTEIDTGNPMWGRVNLLQHVNIQYGAPDVSTGAFDEAQQKIITERNLFQEGRYVGRWQKEITYRRDISRRENRPKQLSYYREAVNDANRKPIEEVRAWFNIQNLVRSVENIHYVNGKEVGISQVQFKYNGHGHLLETIQNEYDQFSTLLRTNKITHAGESGEAQSPAIGPSETPQTEYANPKASREDPFIVPKNDDAIPPYRPLPPRETQGNQGVVAKITGFFRRKQ